MYYTVVATPSPALDGAQMPKMNAHSRSGLRDRRSQWVSTRNWSFGGSLNVPIADVMASAMSGCETADLRRCS
jgi:hypothetical protein